MREIEEEHGELEWKWVWARERGRRRERVWAVLMRNARQGELEGKVVEVRVEEFDDFGEGRRRERFRRFW